jgi:hypothetical protein
MRAVQIIPLCELGKEVEAIKNSPHGQCDRYCTTAAFISLSSLNLSVLAFRDSDITINV